MSLLVINLSKSDVNDCKSKDYIIFNIENEEMLKRLHNRFYYDKQSDKLLLINKHRKELIGTTVHLRSPITCHLDGVHMCKTCLGTMPDNNHFHVALSGVLVLTEQITQILNLMGSLNFFNCWKLLKL